jgi:hypothetical protein
MKFLLGTMKENKRQRLFLFYLLYYKLCIVLTTSNMLRLLLTKVLEVQHGWVFFTPRQVNEKKKEIAEHIDLMRL